MYSRVRNRGVLLLLLLCVLGVSCHDSRPPHVLSLSQMEDVLYDYTLAKSMGGLRQDSAFYYTNYYVNLVFKKHGITQQELDSSLQFYCSSAEDLHKIYVKIGERLNQNNKPISQHTADNYALKTDAASDTLCVWQGPYAYMLHSLQNVSVDFSQEVSDSIYQKGDELRLEFSPVWISSAIDNAAVRHTSAEGYVVLAMVFENDTVISVKNRFFHGGKQDLSTTVPMDGMKEVKGFFYQSGKYQQTPQLLFVVRPVLLRFRGKSAVEKIASPIRPNISLPTQVDSEFKNRVDDTILVDEDKNNLHKDVAKERVSINSTTTAASSASAQKRLRDSLIQLDKSRGKREPLGK